MAARFSGGHEPTVDTNCELTVANSAMRRNSGSETSMPSVSGEIIADITDYTGKSDGDFSAWCVGAARDWGDPALGCSATLALRRCGSSTGPRVGRRQRILAPLETPQR
ncbi:MAG: hypothetical protein HY508_15225 [Acidobacteria bacterium]|nr:hypothetical protein [Acidobacteriota bacterium]